MRHIKEFFESFSAPISFFLIIVPNYCVASSDVVSEKGVFNIHFVFIWASGVHAEVNDFDVFVFDVIIGNFFDGVCVFVNGLIHLLRLCYDILKAANSYEFLFFLDPFHWVSLMLLVVFV